MRIFITALVVLCLAGLRVHAADYYVSPSGNATNPGTVGSPWNLTKAGSGPAAGDTVHIAAGTYNERLKITVSGSAGGGFITYHGVSGAIIDGTAISMPTSGDYEGLVHIDSCSYIRVKGLEIRNWKANATNVTPCGIYVQSSSSQAAKHVELIDNHVHDIWQSAKKAGAHGIGIYGRHATAITGLLIEDNEIDHCRLGWSETLVVNGNVDGFSIVGNHVHDNNNIGIDIIGYERTASTNDYARNGLIARNTVSNIHSNGYDALSANQAYSLNDDGAGGIYVDGARDVVIERNLVFNCDIGIEIGAEHSGGTSNSLRCTLRENIIHSTIQGCIQLGGYKSTLSWSEDCLVDHNTCFNADTKSQGYGLITLQMSRNCTFTNNILLGGTGKMMISATLGAAYVKGHVFNWNNYWATGGTPQYQIISGTTKTGLAAFRTASGQDANSIEVNPLLTSTAGTINLRPQVTSPAIDAGDSAFVAGASETDYDGLVRIMTRTDIGAHEQQLGGTTDTTPPSVSAISAGSITASGATITWTTNEGATGQVKFGLTSTYGNTTTLVTTLTTGHNISVSGLSPATIYHYQVLSSDASNNLATSADHTFTTSAGRDTIVPTLSAINAGSITANSAIITWTTNEAATGQVKFGLTDTYSSTSTLASALTTGHSIFISSLSPATVYHYQVLSRDASNNLVTSTDKTFATLANGGGTGGGTSSSSGSGSSCGVGSMAAGLMFSLILLLSRQWLIR